MSSWSPVIGAGPATRTRRARRLRRALAAAALALPALLASCSGDSEPESLGPSLVVSPSTVELMVGESAQLSVAGATAGVSWSSSDPAVATVEFGRVTAVGAGSAVIVAAAADEVARAEVRVLRPATLVLAAATASFSAGVDDPLPAARAIGITNPGDAPAQGLAVGAITYAGEASDWLAASLSATTAPATLTLQPSSTGLAPGTYTATVPVTSSTAANSPVAVTVTYQITTPPVIALGAPGATFTAQRAAPLPAAQIVAIGNGGGGTVAGLAVGEVTYSADASDWLNASVSGTTAPATLTLQPATTTLPVGTHTATVRLLSSNAANAPVTLTVTYQVTATPVIALGATSVGFTARQTGALPASQGVAVTNTGGGTLAGLAVGTIGYSAGASGWLNASVDPTTAPATLTLRPATTALPPGGYFATVPLGSSVPGVAAATVEVRYDVGTAPVPPAIVLASTALAFTATTGGVLPATQEVGIANGGEGTLGGLAAGVDYPGAGMGWLDVSLSAASAPATLFVRPNSTTLAPGTYSATVSVSSDLASNSPRTVSVAYTVGAPAAIALSQSALEFTTAGGGPPTAQSVTVTNAGGGTLAGLSTSIAYGSGAGWLTASLNTTTAPATLTVRPSTAALAPGTYTATVNVAAPGTSNSPRPLAVTYAVPAIGLAATAATFESRQSGVNPASRTIAVTNAGGGALSGLTAAVAYGSGSGWLSATLDATTAPATLTLGVTTGTILPGSYSATVTIGSSQASSRTVAVTFTRVSTLRFDVQPIFDRPLTTTSGTSCKACHGGGTGPTFTTYLTSHATMVGIASPVCGGLRVQPGDAEASCLYRILTGAVAHPGGPMAISAADRQAFFIWIQQGALRDP